MRYALLMHYAKPAGGELSEEVVAEARHQFDVYTKALGGSVALAMVEAEIGGPAAGLARLDVLPIDRFQPGLAAQAHLLERLGRHGAAAAAYRNAIDLTNASAEQNYLKNRLTDLGN
ncbi:hypothetical protein [Actinoplanes sp. L3-i22]|uniref:hypothetical protein n=1 Tax=Actinoplanes sp. L3-i22 TaxID=2836373 RepID=UPI001C794B4E|nr:hypothetical protein [Actinoplanes sp. L3-i22]BCY10871.1 hypothetical protein L3i22_059590 [Actinoplanes sp. L3-i22]